MDLPTPPAKGRIVNLRNDLYENDRRLTLCGRRPVEVPSLITDSEMTFPGNAGTVSAFKIALGTCWRAVRSTCINQCLRGLIFIETYQWICIK